MNTPSKGKAKHEPQPLPQTRSLPGLFSLAGRASPLELIVHALNATGADGVGRLLDYREFDRDPRARDSS